MKEEKSKKRYTKEFRNDETVLVPKGASILATRSLRYDMFIAVLIDYPAELEAPEGWQAYEPDSLIPKSTETTR